LPVTLDGGQVAQVVGLQSKEPALRLEVGVLHGLAKITGQEVAVLLLAIPNLRVLLNVDKGVLVVVEVRLNAVKLDLDRQLLQHAHQVDDESVPGQQLFITGKLHAAVIVAKDFGDVLQRLRTTACIYTQRMEHNMHVGAHGVQLLDG